MSDTKTLGQNDTVEIARAAARRFLAGEHRVLVRHMDRRSVAEAVYSETACSEIPPSSSLIDAAMNAIRTTRISITWDDEQPTCGAVPEGVLVDLGCRPCSLPAGHDTHKYPYPIPMTPGLPGYACARCGSLFTSPGEPRDRHSRHADSAWCRGCVDQCHEGNDGHRCAICVSDSEGVPQ